MCAQLCSQPKSCSFLAPELRIWAQSSHGASGALPGWDWHTGCCRLGSLAMVPHAGLHPYPLLLASRKQVLGTKVDAERDGVKVPTTLAEYCVKTKTPAPDEGSDLFYDDYYEDDEMEEEAESCYGDEDDSGNEES